MKTETAPDRRATLLRKLNCFPMTAQKPIPLLISGIRVDLVTENQALQKRLLDYFHDFIGQGPAIARLRAEPLKLPLWEDPDPEFDVRGSTVVQRDFVAKRTQETPAEAIAWLSPGIDDAFHNLLRWFLPPILLRNQSFLLHGAGVIRDGQGYVFFGPSEAGKSTTVSLITQSDPEAIALGDDGILIQLFQGQPYVFAAPLGCGYSRKAPPPLSAPLRGLYSLKQDSNVSVTPLTGSQSVTQLIASVMAVHFEDDVEMRLDLATQFAQSPGIQELRFCKDPSFWPILKNHGELDVRTKKY